MLDLVALICFVLTSRSHKITTSFRQANLLLPLRQIELSWIENELSVVAPLKCINNYKNPTTATNTTTTVLVELLLANHTFGLLHIRFTSPSKSSLPFSQQRQASECLAQIFSIKSRPRAPGQITVSRSNRFSQRATKCRRQSELLCCPCCCCPFVLSLRWANFVHISGISRNNLTTKKKSLDSQSATENEQVFWDGVMEECLKSNLILCWEKERENK